MLDSSNLVSFTRPMNRWNYLTLAMPVVAWVAGVACVGDAPSAPPDSGTDAGADASPADAVADTPSTTDVADAPTAPCNLSLPFGTPTLVPGLQTPADETKIYLSKDGLTAVFSAVYADAGSGGSDLYIAQRGTPQSAFGNIQPIGPANTASNEWEPTLTGDGLTLVFSTDRSVTSIDLYVATRASTLSSFGAATALTGFDTSAYEAMPSLLESGAALYFIKAPTPNDTPYIYRAGKVGPSFVSPVQLNELGGAVHPAISADELTIFWASTRADGGAKGAQDVWTATRATATDAFSNPKNVSEVNGSTSEYPDYVTSDGCSLYFASNRSGNYDLYYATRPK